MKNEYSQVKEILDKEPNKNLADISDELGLDIDIVIECEQIWSME